MDNERHALDHQEKKQVFKLILMEEGWGNLHLDVSDIEILDHGENVEVGTLNYELTGYTDEDLELIGKTEEELISHCNDLMLEILEKGLKVADAKKDEELLESIRKNT